MTYHNISKVYREDWGFHMADTERFFLSDNDLIKNDSEDGAEELDYIWSDRFDYCKDVDYALYTIEYDLVGLFESRLNVEYTVVTAFVRYIQEFWCEEGWDDAISAVEDVERGYYDEEMLSYDAYLKAEYVLQSIQDSRMSPVDLGEELRDIIQVVDIKDELVTMMEQVMNKLKNDEYYVDFATGKLKEHL